MHIRLIALRFFLISTVLVSHLAAQTSSKPGPSGPTPRGTSRLYVTPAPGQVPTTLKELCAKSSLIIEGTVLRPLPARETSPGSLETGAVISVVKAPKGHNTVRQVAVASEEVSPRPLASFLRSTLWCSRENRILCSSLRIDGQRLLT